MELVNEKAVKLALPIELSNTVVNNIEQSKILDSQDGVSNLLVYWGLEEMTKLNKLVRLKNNLPSPIRRDYKYPGLYKPFDHQATTAEFLSINEKAFCFNEADLCKLLWLLEGIDSFSTQNFVKLLRVTIIFRTYCYLLFRHNVQLTGFRPRCWVSPGTFTYMTQLAVFSKCSCCGFLQLV